MSFNSYDQQFTDAQLEQIRRESSSIYDRKKNTRTWYNPVTDSYHLAANPVMDPNSDTPDYGPEITKPGVMSKAREALRKMGGSASKTDWDHFTYQPIRNEFLKDAVGFNQKIENAKKQYNMTGDVNKLIGAGTLTLQDYPAIANIMLDTTVEELVVRDFVILQAFNRKPWDKLVYTFDSKTPFRNTYGLGELDVPDSRSIAYGRGTINLTKGSARISVSIWIQLSVRDHNIETDNSELIDQDWERGFSAEAATTLQLYTNQAAGGLYDALTGEHNTTNPAIRFDADTASIRTAGGIASILVMNSKTYRVLYENSWMKTTGQSTPLGSNAPYTPTSARVVTLTKMPGFTIYIDETMPTGSIIIADKRGHIWLDGPRSQRTIESNYGQVVENIHDRWYGSGLKFSGFGVEETGTAS